VLLGEKLVQVSSWYGTVWYGMVGALSDKMPCDFFWWYQRQNGGVAVGLMMHDAAEEKQSPSQLAPHHHVPLALALARSSMSDVGRRTVSEDIHSIRPSQAS
jgi:hypothetical protein